MKRNKLKIKKKSILFVIVLLISIGFMGYSLYKIITWQKENKETDSLL